MKLTHGADITGNPLTLLSILGTIAAIQFFSLGLLGEVSARLAGVVFFLGFQPREYNLFGYFDFVFFVPELVLLAMMARGDARRPQPANVPAAAWRAR